MLDATFTASDLTTFTRLDELGLVVVGQRLEPGRTVLAGRVVEEGAVAGAGRGGRVDRGDDRGDLGQVQGVGGAAVPRVRRSPRRTWRTVSCRIGSGRSRSRWWAPIAAQASSSVETLTPCSARSVR